MADSCLLMDQSRYCQVKVYSLAGQGSSRHMVVSKHDPRYQAPKDRYRHIYFEALELAYAEVERRFDIQTFQFLLVQAANDEILQPDECLLKYRENDVDEGRLSVQLSDLIKDAFQDTHIRIKSVTNVRTIAEAMNRSEIYKRMLGKVHKILKLTFPVFTATAE